MPFLPPNQQHQSTESTLHKIGHFGGASQANLLAWHVNETKPNTTKARIHQSKEMYYNTNTKNYNLTAVFHWYKSITRCDAAGNLDSGVDVLPALVECSQP